MSEEVDVQEFSDDVQELFDKVVPDDLKLQMILNARLRKVRAREYYSVNRYKILLAYRKRKIAKLKSEIECINDEIYCLKEGLK